MANRSSTSNGIRLTYISRNYKSTGYAGGKARVDIEDVLSDMGAVNLGLRRTFHSNKIVDYLRNLAGIARYMWSVRKGDVVVIQYPLKKYFRLVCRWAHFRHARTITLIHDLGSFRRKRLTIDQEIRKLSLTDVVIAANQNTIKWLRDHGCTIPMTEQTAWDFLSDAPINENEYTSNSCAFIGSVGITANGYLYQLPPEVELHLYGGYAPNECRRQGIFSYGHKSHDELIAQSAGRYGLIWYGASPAEHVGFIGEYIKYCNPHKLALYMRCLKPVILWKGSGQAQFVRSEGIGLTVDTLENLDKTLASVTAEQYRQMKSNVKRVAKAMSSGFYFRQALKNAIQLLDKPS